MTNSTKPQSLLKGKKVLLAMVSLLFAGFSMAQVKLSGKVTNSNGSPAEGVSVALKGTTAGTTTDFTGTYTLKANVKPGSYTIVFSGVGFKSKEVKAELSAATTLDASLNEEVNKLDEVVVTGTSAGTTRKQLGSYVSTVKAADLSKGAAGNALQALQGKTAGAQITQNSGDPAGGMSVRLRGVSSINSSSEPL